MTIKHAIPRTAELTHPDGQSWGDIEWPIELLYNLVKTGNQSMTVPWDFTLSHIVSQARLRQWNIQLLRLWNGISGRVEGHYKTRIFQKYNVYFYVKYLLVLFIK